VSWWTTRSTRWQIAPVARIGGGTGAGGLLLLFRSSDVPVSPVMAAVADGPAFTDSASAGWMRSGIIPGLATSLPSGNGAAISAVSGKFSMQDIQGRLFQLVGGGRPGLLQATCQGKNLLFNAQITIRPNLPRIGLPVFDMSPIYGGMGAPLDSFSASLVYVGT
jgi:hypothetical protein